MSDPKKPSSNGHGATDEPSEEASQAAGSGGALWAGRFSKPAASEAHALGRSLQFDLELIGEDIEASAAHVEALSVAGLLTPDEAAKLVVALEAVPDLIVKAAEEADDVNDLFPEIEDVHMLVEHMVTEQLGDLGAKLHAGRSRNDLVVTDFRLWCLHEASDVVDGVELLLATLVERAREGATWVMPGLTHNRPAQVVTLGFHLMAHAFAFTRDLERFDGWFERTSVSPLGAGALATSTLGLDPAATAERLHFERAFDNALDATADRDFALEFLSVSTILGIHLSRLAADLARWSEPAVGYVEMDEAYSTGSSMMPQKRNPDVAELSRGKAGRLVGDLVSLATMLTGLPLGYHRDLQEDKEPAFDAAQTLKLVLPALSGCLATARFQPEAMRLDCAAPDLYATDVAEALVLQGVPFRDAHRRTGQLLKSLAETGHSLRDMTPSEWETFGVPQGGAKLDPDASVAARDTAGGPAPGRVAEQIAAIDAVLAARR